LDKVLIIDDEIAICTSMEFALEDEYEVLTATNPEKALSLLASNEINVVLLDLKLNKHNGLVVLKDIKKLYYHIPVIIMTAYGSIKSTIDAIKEGAYYYLTKPLNIEELKILLAKACEFQKLSEEVRYLNQEVKEKYGLGNIIGKSEAIIRVFEIIEKVKDIYSNILITGESGTGKELVARAIHYLGKRGHSHFEVVNCAAIPANLLESELFGYEKGAFTGAVANKLGKFELAHKGTIFLDEIGDMDYSLQAKLLRVLQNKEITPLGSNKKRDIDVRVIAATNKDLEGEVEKGNFREDLFYRLNVIPIRIPPLRERKEDIPLLINKFINKYSTAFDKNICGIEPMALKILEGYEFKGNVRELENIIERTVALSTETKINHQDLPFKMREQEHLFANEANDFIAIYIGENLKEAEKKIIKKTLEVQQGNRKKTAEILGISERGLRYKISEYEL